MIVLITHEKGNNLLHVAVAIYNDEEAVRWIIDSQTALLSLSKLLNTTNDKKCVHLILQWREKIAQILMQCEGQKIDFSIYMS